MAHVIDFSLKKIIRQRYIAGTLRRNALAGELHLDKGTVKKYELECRQIEEKYPYKLENLGFWIKKEFPSHKCQKKDHDMMTILPGLVDACQTSTISPLHLWPEYQRLCPDGYTKTWFQKKIKLWRMENNFSIYHHRRIREIPQRSLDILNKWRKCNERKKWQRATIILDSYEGKNIHETVERVELSLPIVLKWIDLFKEKGIEVLIDEPYTLSKERTATIQAKQANVSKLIHESPRLHGLNRNTWTIELLTIKYKEVYGHSISPPTVSAYLAALGYGFSKSRERLTSPDQKFREKIDHIKHILANLKADEKFFSVDEFGHFAIKVKGGWSHTKRTEPVIIPQKQKSKGVLLMTAALELSGNQLTHFYSAQKNTAEMIKLIEILMKQYRDASILYLSWDAAGWHKSNKLKEAITEWNSDAYRTINQTPKIELAPLPSSAQFLNVIESVFSGMARAIIHNSDYQGVEECKAAIDRYVYERNAHFLKYPKRAGKYLWGMEKVKPVFDEANNCKTRVRIRHAPG
ncbi:MAG: hypothetical protein JWQ66_4450 [Mucilaginibacter sp.]|nr:hypothetical protein [Mucilaginibacter sp.]